MNKTYFIPPVLFLIVFFCAYKMHSSELKVREVARVAKVEADLKAKNEAEQETRKTAMADAIKAAEQRKAERLAKEAKDKADKEIREAAIDARDKAYREQEKLAKQLDRLAKDITTEQDALAKLAAARKDAEAEKSFLLDFVSRSQGNMQALRGLLTKLDTPPLTVAVTK